MLTIAGKNHIRRYLAQYVPNIAGAMAFGVGSRNAVGNDFAMNFEVLRVKINSIIYDFASNKLIYKATIPAEFSGTITEVGLYSLFEDPKAGAYGTGMLSPVDESEGWVQTGTTTASAFTATGAKIGPSGLSQSPSASATRNDSLSNLVLDMSGYSGADFITIALNIGNTNAGAIEVYFKNDASNYYKFSVPSANVAGYTVYEFLKSSATVTGSPDWSSITEIQFSTVSGSGGAAAVTWDGIGFVDTDTNNLDYTLVARRVLSSPVVVAANQSQEIEFALDVAL